MRTTGRAPTAALVAFAVAALAGGCASTADRANERRTAQAAEAAKLAEASAALEVVKVQGIDTRVLAVLDDPDQGLAAVVVDLRSTDPKRSVVWAPIDVQLTDAGGAVVAENNVEGANATLVHVPSLPASGQAFYVNDQFAPEAPPTGAKVTLGGEMVPLQPPPAPLKTTGAELVDDPNYGASFVGTVVNSTSVRQEQLIVQAIVRRGEEVVAAGTSIVSGLDPGDSAEFTGFFIGDPAGGELEVIVPPSNWPGVEGAPPEDTGGEPTEPVVSALDDGVQAPA